MKQFLAFHRHNIMVPYPVFGDDRTLLSGTADIVATCIYFTQHTIIGEAVGSAACVRLADLGRFAAAHTGTPSHPNIIGPSRPVNWDSELPPPPPPRTESVGPARGLRDRETVVTISFCAV